MAAAEKRQIQLDENTAKAGFEKYRAAELAKQEWDDWVREQEEVYGLDPAVDQVGYNPVTGRFSVVVGERPKADAPAAPAEGKADGGQAEHGEEAARA